MKRLKVGVVGAGPISAFVHLPALSAMRERLEFVALAELDEQIGREFAEKYHVRHYKTHLEMLDNEPDLDIVDICTAPLTHHILVHDVAERGINITVEKPLAMTLPIADFVLDVVKRNKVHFQVSENYPLMPWDLVISQISDRGLFGEIVNARVYTPVNDLTFDICVHHYSQVREFMRSAPRSVVAAMRASKLVPDKALAWNRRHPGLFGETIGCYGISAIEFENGADAFIECFPFPQQGKNEDYYFAGDLRRLSGTKLIVMDNMWPVIHPAKDQQEEFHVLQLNDDTTFNPVPVEIERASIGGEQYVCRISVKTDPAIEWKIPPSATSGFVITEPSYNSFGCRIMWRTAMMGLYDRLYRKIVSNQTPAIDPVYRESIEVCVAMLHSEALGRKRVELPLREVTEYEDNFHKMYKEKMGEDIFGFTKSGARNCIGRVYDKYRHPLMDKLVPGLSRGAKK